MALPAGDVLIFPLPVLDTAWLFRRLPTGYIGEHPRHGSTQRWPTLETAAWAARLLERGQVKHPAIGHGAATDDERRARARERKRAERARKRQQRDREEARP